MKPYTAGHPEKDADSPNHRLPEVGTAAGNAREAGGEGHRAAHAAGDFGPREVHTGHGLPFGTVASFPAMEETAKRNIGPFLIGGTIFASPADAMREIRRRMDAAREAAPA